MKKWQLGLIAVLLVVAGFFAALKNIKTELPAFGVVPDFQFENQTGRIFSSEELKNRVWVAGFIFTRCEGPCPVISSKMAQLKKRLHYSSRLKLVSFSVDPEYDTADKLAAYAARFDVPGKPEWVFLTGPKEKIYELAVQAFMQTASDDASQTDVQARFMHGTRLALIDSRGQIRGFYDSQDAGALDLLERDIRAIL